MVGLRWSVFFGRGVVFVFIRKELPEFRGLIVPLPAGLRKELVGVQWNCRCAVRSQRAQIPLQLPWGTLGS